MKCNRCGNDFHKDALTPYGSCVACFNKYDNKYLVPGRDSWKPTVDEAFALFNYWGSKACNLGYRAISEGGIFMVDGYTESLQTGHYYDCEIVTGEWFVTWAMISNSQGWPVSESTVADMLAEISNSSL